MEEKKRISNNRICYIFYVFINCEYFINTCQPATTAAREHFVPATKKTDVEENGEHFARKKENF